MNLDDVLVSALAAWPAQGALGALGTGSSSALAGAWEKPFAWASVTKLLVALCTLVAVEEGTLGLDQPAGPEGSTVSHLLAHASGLPFDGSAPVAPPGRRRIYSNTGYEALAAHLERAARVSFGDYLKEAVLGPLSMSSTALAGSPAHGASGPVTDLLALAGELLSPTLVSAETWALATSVAFPGLAGVVPGFGRFDPCDWGLGPELRDAKSPHWTGSRNSPATYGHFGQSGSFLWADPAAGVALCGLSAEAFGPWAKRAWPEVSDAVLAAAQ